MAAPELVTVDIETYYDMKDYSLSKMTTEEYINDPRFEIIGVGVKVGDQPAEWRSFSTQQEYERYLQNLKDHYVICHNMLFDGAILAWKLGIRPKMLLDTLSMARPFHNANVGGSLKKLVEIYELGEKGTEVVQANGKRLSDFNPTDLAQYGEYCKNDCDLTWALFNKLSPRIPASELRLIDLTLRMYIQPVLMLDPSLIEREMKLDQEKKAAMFEKLASLDLGPKALSSNNQFAEILQSLGVDPPTKVSAKTGKTSWAFAKGDADFLALLGHDDPMVVAAIEARMGSKSTQKQSRAQRFLDIHRRMKGYLPVPLIYYSAHTGRYGGGESINLQNLQRAKKGQPDSGLLRKAIMAPPGHTLVVADYSQIEARFLAWLARQKDKVEAFAQKRDVYSEQATVIYGRKVDRKNNPDDFTPGFIGKAVVLGCLAPDTQVLTDSGWKSIVCVKTTDLLWDGESWVRHLGVVEKGMKPVQTAFGLTATDDHEIWTGHGWRDWSVVSTNPSLFQSALLSANLPSSSGAGTSELAGGQQGGNLLSGACVDGKGRLIERTSSKVGLPNAINAPKLVVALRARSIGGMLKYFQMTHIGNACSTAYRALSLGVTHHIAKCLNTMGDAAYSFMKAGAPEWQGGERFLATSLPSMDGTDLNARLTEWTSTVGTSRGIYGSQPNQKTPKISAVSPTCKTKSLTYDIACSGPRNRFTVATSVGPVIVHNCGYGLGYLKFARMIYTGMLGEKGILFDDAYVDTLGTDPAMFKARLISRNKFDDVMETMPLMLDEDAWMKHCSVAQKIINVFRNSNPKVVDLWQEADTALHAMFNDDEYAFGGPTGDLLKTEKNAIILPNGMRLRYEGLEYGKDGFSYMRRKEGRVQRVKAYGGSVVENCVQALARIPTMNMMMKADKVGLQVALQVHDEIVVVAPDESAQAAYDWMIAKMRQVPKWAEGLPLDAEGGLAKRYGDAK